MTCINCGSEAEGNFCASCGQRTTVKRINFKEGWHDFWSRVYGFDGMFPRTLKDLTIRPGMVAREYIEKNRVKYYGPAGYFFFLISLCLLLFSLMDVSFVEYIKGVQDAIPLQQGGNAKMNQWVLEFVSDNIKIFAFLIVPFLAISSRYFFFRKSGLNFLEHTILPFYTLGHIYWLTIIFGVFLKLTGIHLGGYSGLITIPYIGFAYAGQMTHQSKTKAFFKGVGCYLFANLLFALFMVIVGIVVVLLIAAFNPELFEQLRPSNNR